MCRPHFPAFASAFQAVYSNIATWRLDGTPVCSLLPAPDGGLDMSGTPGFEHALATDGFTITPVHRGRRSGRWSTVLTAPIHDEQGAHVGMISLSVDLVHFQDIVQRLNVPEDGVVSLTQLDNTVVARSTDSERWVGSAPPTMPAPATIPTFSRRGFSVGPHLRRRRVRVGLRPGARHGVGGLRGPAPRDGRTDRFGRSSSACSSSARFIVVGAGLLGFGAYRAVTRPLQALVEGIAAAPRSANPLPTDGPAEIAWVAERFNRAWSERLEAERTRTCRRRGRSRCSRTPSWASPW